MKRSSSSSSSRRGLHTAIWRGAKAISGFPTTDPGQGELHDALKDGRQDDLRHQATGRGPHRDEMVITLDGMPARTHASQGEQRCVALALRLAGHELATAEIR